MATLGTDILTMAEFSKRTDPDGTPAQMANVLTQECPFLKDAPILPSNMIASHRSTVVTGLPVANRRRLNAGTPASRGTTAQVTDSITMYDSWSVIDAKELEIVGDAETHRSNEIDLHMESIAQLVDDDIVYGSETDSDLEFNGFMSRPSLNALSSKQVINAGGSGSDNASVLLVGWSPQKVYLVYPKNSPYVGIKHKDWDAEPVMEGTTDIAASTMEAYRDHLCVELGLVVKDERFVSRVANIDMSDLTTFGGQQALTDLDQEIVPAMIRATHRIHSLTNCRPVFYMPRSVYEFLDIHYVARTGVNVFKYSDVAGEKIATFRNIPVRISDRMIYAEPAVA